MKKITLSLILLIASFTYAQTVPDSLSTNPQTQQNAAQRILSGNINTGVTVGGYGEITYNQPEADNGELDVQRLVLLFGYKFNDRVQFVTEIELEHVEEIFVEQAFVQYSLTDNVNLRGGLMLVPMGITNEYHEPTTFNGVERPSIDKSIVPTTWREIGFGVAGRLDDVSLRYQAYVFNGFKSVNGTKVLGGANGLRNGRQKGIQSTVDSPNFAAKLDYYGLPGLRLGLSGYFGRTQAEDDIEDIDGTSVGISMIGLDARYAYKRFTARGQYIHANISDTEDYNTLNSADLGSALQGWYVEGAYNLLPQNKEQQLFAFARYSDYDTHASVEGALVKNDAYDRDEWTFGLSYKIAPGAVVKADYQFFSDATDVDSPNQLNIGLGVWF
ncbi:phosphate-selective porin O/P [Winogradskyella pacifica]|uniref:Phosphate-selective porin O/P n=1 Tax=Winogradskyella pacifica TaxID=664642 RepID=A0A3D9LP58_9FLAO|nr:porin [Winogradskyella pacifica]REE08207.1 phosphate-selective porin O/P [Winogradskyella pacifica]